MATPMNVIEVCSETLTAKPKLGEIYVHRNVRFPITLDTKALIVRRVEEDRVLCQLMIVKPNAANSSSLDFHLVGIAGSNGKENDNKVMALGGKMPLKRFMANMRLVRTRPRNLSRQEGRKINNV